MDNKEVKEFTFQVNENEANIVLNALAKESFYVVNQLINKIQKQAAEQVQPIKK